ncbi:MAG: hypothetical protein ACOCUM_02320 [Thiohalospira sp.]
MSQNLIKQVNINGLEYNKFRDPNNYRKAPGEDYRFKVRLNGSGTATARLEVDNQTVCEETVSLPGVFTCTTKFDTPGARPAFLTVEANGEKETREYTVHIWEREKRDTKEEVPPHH